MSDLGLGMRIGSRRPRLKAAAAAAADAAQLLADLTTDAGGTAPTGLWVPGVGTTKNVGGDPAVAGDTVYQIEDQSGNGYHLIEHSSGKGGTFRAAQIGTAGAVEFDRTNSEALKVNQAFNGSTPNLCAADDHTILVLGNWPDNNVNQSTARRNPGIFGASGTGAPYLVLRDNTGTRLIGASGSGATLSIQNSTTFPYDTDQIAGLRYQSGVGYEACTNTIYDGEVGSGSITLTDVPSFGVNVSDIGGNVFCSGFFSVMVVWNVGLTDAQHTAAVSTIDTYAGGVI